MKNTKFRRHATRSLCLVAAVLLASGCDGDTGPAGPAGPGGSGVPVTSTATSLTVTVDSVTIASPPVVDFTVTNELGTRFVGLTSAQVRFALAKLIPGSNGDPSAWQSYINRQRSPPAGSGSTEDAIQGTTENNGTFVANGDGTYRYTFATDVTNVTTPAAVSYQPGLTHRLGIQISGGTIPVTNAIYDWRPSDGATTGLTTREIVQTASCNECHGKLAEHGGGRIDTQFCVMCHNPGTNDLSGKTVDFKVMVHKIHRGAELPSVQAPGGEYAIWSSTKHDYSDVVYPQDIRNCTKCHDAADAATPDGGNWATEMSVEACGSCHDDVNFTTGANHSPSQFVAQNGECTICHSDAPSADFAPTPIEAHVIPAKAEGLKYAFNVISVTNTAPGEFPVITYEVTDPTNAGARYNVISDPEWTGGSLSLTIGWSTADYHNTGNGSTTRAGSPVTLGGRAASTGNNAAPTANADGTFTVTSLRAVDANAVGSGSVGMYGRATADFDANGTFTDRVPIKSIVEYFPITDAVAEPRRDVVDIAKCNLCHDQLTLHGSARTDEPQLCAVCHNADNSDLSQRIENTGNANNIWPPPDGLTEQTIDFKVMIHAIHGAAKRENPYIVYGNNNSTDDFSHVGYPGVLNNCATCHADESFQVPLASSVLATTMLTGSVADHSDDTNITPTAAVCSSCHDTEVAQTHMEQNGASFVMVGDPGTYNETCSVCHGPGRLADVAEVHAVTP